MPVALFALAIGAFGIGLTEFVVAGILPQIAADFGVDTSPRLKVLKTEEPSGRKAGVKVKSVAELVDKLKNEAGVL